MNTNAARQQAPSAQDEREEQAAVQVPVLIRLPDVSASVFTTQDPSGQHVVWKHSEVLDDPPSQAGVARDKRAPDPVPPSEAPLKDERSRPKAGEFGRLANRVAWSDFSLPPSVVNAVVALSLIAVFMVAYTAIVGGRGSKELAEGNPAANDKSAMASTNTESLAVETELDAMLPKIPAASFAHGPSGQQQPQTSAAEETPAPQPNTQTPAKQDAPAAMPAAADSKTPALPAQPAFAAKTENPSVQQTEFESSASSSQSPSKSENQTEQLAADTTSTPADNRWVPGFSNETAQDRTASAGSADGLYQDPLPTSSIAASDAAHPAYPATNPASFQYPVDYHRHLIGADARDADRPSPWTDGAAVYGQRPSTARMQPRMDAPPIR